MREYMQYHQRANFLRKWEFEIRFGRDPKHWSFENLRELYERAKERSEKRRKDFQECIDRILSEIEPDGNGEIRVYFEQGESTRYYAIRKDREYGWCYSMNNVYFSSDRVAGRNEKIELLLAKGRQFEMGEELLRLEKMKSGFDHRIFHIIEDAANERLKEIFKGTPNHMIPKILKVDLGGKVYYAALTEQARGSGQSWKEFKIVGSEEEETIKL